MERFDFEKLFPLNPLETLFREWYFEACGPVDRTPEEILSLLSVCNTPQRILDEYAAAAAENSAAAFYARHGLDGADDVLIRDALKMLEFYRHYLSAPQMRLIREDGSGSLFPYDSYVRYHDRYCPVVPHSHAFFELVFMVKGCCRHIVGGDSLDMRSGDIIIVPPKTVHSIYSFSDENIMYNMHVKASTFEQNFLTILNSQNILGSFFRRTLYAGENCKSYLVIQTGDYLSGNNLLASLCSETNSDHTYKRDMLNTMSKLLFLYLLENYSDSIFASMIDSEDPGAIVEMMNLIQTSLGSVTMEELSARFNYSSRHITRLIAKYTGSTLRELRKSLRLKRAGQLLSESELSVETIAAECGYTSTNHFYSDFKSKYSATPLAYRKNHSQ